MSYQIYNDPDYNHVKHEIYERILKGEHVEDIKTDLVDRFGFERSTLDVYCTEIYALFNESIENERENVIALHINRYDEHYKAALALALDHDPQGDIRDRQSYYTYLNEALDALEDKEKTLNMHSKKFNVFIKQIENNINISGKGISLLDFDLELLDFEEKVELLKLLGKCETSVKTDIKNISVSEIDNHQRKIDELKTFEEKEVEDVDMDGIEFSEDQITKVIEKEEEAPHTDWQVAKSIRDSYRKEVEKLDEKIKEQRDLNKKFEDGENET